MKINWKEKVLFLQESGFTQQQIADFVGCSQSAIGNICSGSRGKNVSYSIGIKIIEMVDRVKNSPVPD